MIDMFKFLQVSTPTSSAAQALSCLVCQFLHQRREMLRPVPMALDSDVEDASPTSASKEFEADICFMLLSDLWQLSVRHFQYHGMELSSKIAIIQPCLEVG